MTARSRVVGEVLAAHVGLFLLLVAVFAAEAPAGIDHYTTSVWDPADGEPAVSGLDTLLKLATGTAVAVSAVSVIGLVRARRARADLRLVAATMSFASLIHALVAVATYAPQSRREWCLTAPSSVAIFWGVVVALVAIVAHATRKSRVETPS